MFILYGVPGLALAVLILLTIREPARDRMAGAPARRSQPLRDIVDTLRSPGLTPLYIATAFSTLSATGV